MMTPERRACAVSPDIAAHLAILYTIGYFAIVFTMMYGGIPPENKDALNQLIGGLTIIQTGIIGFYFGGSKQMDQQRAIEQRRIGEWYVQESARTGAEASTAAPVTVPLEQPREVKS